MPVDQLYIFGAGGHSSEITEYLDNVKMKVILVEDKPTSTVLHDYDVISKKTCFENHKGFFHIGIGHSSRGQIFEEFLEKGFKPFNIIQNTSFLGKKVVLGNGVLIAPKVVITAHVKLGNNVLVNIGSNISHNVQIGDHTVVSPGCNLTGNVIIGKNVFIGAGVTVLPHIIIEDNVIIGAGSVVTKNIKKNTLVKGIPAK